MSDLKHLLELSTDEVPSPDLTARALTIARRRRARRRGGLAVVAAAAAVTAVLVVPRVLDLTPASVPPADTGPAPSPDAVTERWDPRSADRLPASTWGELPARIDVPASTPYLGDDPLSEAWLVVGTRLPENDGGLLVLGTDGTWRSLPDGGLGAPAPSLSRDGTRLLVPLAGGGAQLWDLSEGLVTVPEPAGWVPWDFEAWAWSSATEVLAVDAEGGWLVRVPSGRAERVGRPRGHPSTWAVAPDGEVVEGSGLDRPVVTDDWIAGTTYADGPFRVEVRSRNDADAVHRLEIEDVEGNYSGGALQVASVAADGSVLLRMSVPGPTARDGWRLVSWQPATGDLALVATSEDDPSWSTWFAHTRLGDEAP